MNNLAINGGSKTLNIDSAHYVWPVISNDTINVVNKQLQTSISIYNKSGIIEEFENKFKSYHNIKFGLLTNSGTTAIYSMYKAINLMPGDEIICPIYTFFATVTPLLYTGARPIFCDCMPNGNISSIEIEKKITSKTKAIVITHMWGIPCDMDAILKLCTKYNLLLLEDCSHAHGARYKGRIVGTFGTAAAWSLQGQKIISGGEGGIMLTNDSDVYYKAQLLGHYNKRCIQEIPKKHPLYDFSVTGAGLKFRSHPLAVAIANQQFDNLDNWLKCKRAYANQIIESLKEFPFLQIDKHDDSEPSWYALIIKYVEEKANGISLDTFYKALKAEGLIEMDIPNSTAPLNLYPLFNMPHTLFPEFYPINDSFIEETEFPVAIDFYNSIIKMPIWALTDDIFFVEKYIEGIRKVALAVNQNF